MIAPRWTDVLAALAVSMACCGGSTILDHGTGGTGSTGATGGTGGTANPLVGSWNGSATFGSMTLSEQMTLRSDGTATAIDTFANMAGACSGELDVTDAWTSTSSTLSVSNGTCTGQVGCPIDATFGCGTQETASQTCTYTLSNGNDTLVLDCPEAQGPISFTRQN